MNKLKIGQKQMLLCGMFLSKASCWLSFRNKFYPKAYIFGSVVCAIYALYKVFDENGLIDWITKHGAQNIAETMKAEKPWIEETR